MIDWSNAPEEATHYTTLKGDVSFLSWAKVGDDGSVKVFMQNGYWFPARYDFTLNYDVIARPAPRTETDDIIDLVRDQKRAAFLMGYRQGYHDREDGNDYAVNRATAEYEKKGTEVDHSK